MPVLQWIKEYTFDLNAADQALSKQECQWLYKTMVSAKDRGESYGNQAIKRIISYSIAKNVACRASKCPDKAKFQEYLQYLQRRTTS